MLGFHGAQFEKSDIGAEIPTYFSSMIGWPEMVQAITQACEKITPAQRSQTAILTNNYAQAAAVDLLGKKYGLPKAISGHENYWFWDLVAIRERKLLGSASRPKIHDATAPVLKSSLAWTCPTRPIG
ncbi:MAG TPA: hypothetical protein VMT53_25800 [Terriglobales bacterium]|nr:hypothetical protein [Terriglobales bacterium]